jgi:hypothetical protein
MARKAINIELTGDVSFTTKDGHTFSFSGTNVYEGFENVKESHHGHENHGHSVIHLTEVESGTGETNMLTHPVTLTGAAADALIKTLSAGTSLLPDTDDHGHHHG